MAVKKQSKKYMANKKDGQLTAEQEHFCRLYATDYDCMGNGTRAYIIAYGLNPENPNDYKTASVGSTRNLDKPHVIAKINQLLDAEGLNDLNTDKQLLHLIQQHADKPTKLNAIKEYNKMRGRIIERSQLDVNNKQTVVAIVKQYATPRPSELDNSGNIPENSELLSEPLINSDNADNQAGTGSQGGGESSK